MSGSPEKFHSVLVIDDHKMVVIGIKLLIVDKFRDFYQAGNGAAGIELARRHQPDLVIVDNVLPDMSGDMVTKEIRSDCPATRILGYSFNMNAAAILKMVDAGIHGYVDKSGTDAEFTRAVIFLLEGRDYFSKEALQHVIKGSASGEDHTELIAANTGFTAREIEIIRLICQRKKLREISRRLELPEKMVEQALTDIMHRIGARDKADVIKFAIQQGIIGLNEL
ncbi:MAG TPA: response regulator transcription factor [Puia sp.]|nr:response regulator transcription factor [Puia sp.]